MQVTVYCDAKALDAVVTKMAQRAKKMARVHPLHNKTYAELEPVFWKKITDALTRHCQVEHADPITDYAFVFGAPLDDTVFMFTPGISGREVTRTVDVEHSDTSDVVVDFYTHVTP